MTDPIRKTTDTSEAILERFRKGYAKDIDLTLRPAYRDLLAKLGSPHLKLPPVFHVAGTNGKGSTCAFLRAILEAAGYKVHVYTSPHLISYRERIRIAGELISENELADILGECEKFAQPHAISLFEAITAAAFTAFARHPADFVILETGLGGRLDATNVVERPLATLITRLSYDHREYLGDSLRQIAGEKAGIMRANVPCFVAQQPDAEASEALQVAAQKINAPLFAGGRDWKVEITDGGFRFADKMRIVDLPPPGLLGAHQYQNAGLAIAALAALPQAVPEEAIRKGLRNVEWPARLQQLKQGALAALVPANTELWLDGGHNDSAGEALAAQAKIWSQDGRPLYLVMGMLTTKRPQEFLRSLAPYVAGLRAVDIPNEAMSFLRDDLAAAVRGAGIVNSKAAASVQDALQELAGQGGRILICGSLYLAGHVLALNQRAKI